MVLVFVLMLVLLYMDDVVDAVVSGVGVLSCHLCWCWCRCSYLRCVGVGVGVDGVSGVF